MSEASVSQDRWFPLMRSEELVPRHVAQARLLGQEIALWRDDAGLANGWENRCPHRGVRLSIGINDGLHLRCQYHGWRFASGSGQCSFIPAHPDLVPAEAFRAHVYRLIERDGYVWASLGNPLTLPSIDIPSGWQSVTLRSIAVNVAVRSVAAALDSGYLNAATVSVIDEFTLRAEMTGQEPGFVLFLLQPMSDAECLIHALVASDLLPGDGLSLLRRHNAALTALRDRLEAEAAAS